MEQIRNRYFQYICSVLNPLIFKAFCLFLIGMEQMVQMSIYFLLI